MILLQYHWLSELGCWHDSAFLLHHLGVHDGSVPTSAHILNISKPISHKIAKILKSNGTVITPEVVPPFQIYKGESVKVHWEREPKLLVRIILNTNS